MECGDLEGHLTTNISSLFCESVLQRAGAPRKCEGSWFSSNKGIYLAELILKKLRAKKSNHWIGCHEYLYVILIVFLLKIWKL